MKGRRSPAPSLLAYWIEQTTPGRLASGATLLDRSAATGLAGTGAPSAEQVVVTLTAKPGETIDQADINKCLDHTTGKVEKQG